MKRGLPCLLLLLCLSARAATNNLADGAYATITNGIGAATAGDTLVIPAGTWSIPTCIVMSNKSVSIIGAGTNSTIFIYDVNPALNTNNYSFDSHASQSIFTIYDTQNGAYELSGFRVDPGATNYSNSGDGVFQFLGTTKLIRMDHIFVGGVNNRAVQVFTAVCGVADHCQFNYTANNQPFLIRNGDTFGGSNGNDSWKTNVTYYRGTTNAWYIEDCIFAPSTNSYVGLVDAWHGGLFVFRFNYAIDHQLHFGGHGTESSQIERGVRLIEAYGNHTTNTSSFDHALEYRSGTGIIFGNYFDGPYSSTSLIIKGSTYRTASWDSPWNTADATMNWERSLDTNGVSHVGSSGAAGVFATGTLSSGGNSGNGGTATDSSANWTVNQWYGYTLRAFTNFTASSATTTNVTVTGAGWTVNQFVQWCISDLNDTTGTNKGYVFSNSVDTITFGTSSGTYYVPKVTAGDVIQLSHADSIASNTKTNIITDTPHDNTVVPYAAGQIYEIRLLDTVLDSTGLGKSLVPNPTSRPAPQDLQQTSTEPLYQWGNTNRNSGVATLLTFGSTIYIKTNRDFLNYIPAFDGTAGMGIGSAAQMAAITPTLSGAGFWVTNEGSWDTTKPANTSGRLYTWSNSAWVLTYTPLTYPYPLVGPNGIVTNLALSANPSPSTNGVSVTFTVPVQTNYATASDATGTVTFWTNSPPGGTAFGTGSLSSGSATFSSSALTPGTWSIVATWPGSGGYLSLTSGVLSQIVYSNAPPPPPASGGTIIIHNATATGVRITQ